MRVCDRAGVPEGTRAAQRLRRAQPDLGRLRVIVRRETVVPAPPEEVWSLVSDPARLPQWWPGVTRVEEATAHAWTTVVSSPKGKSVRMDYTREGIEEGRSIRWRQEVAQ